MPFNSFIDKLADKLPKEIRDKIPPQIPIGTKPGSAGPPPVPGNRPSGAPLQAYWRADFNPGAGVDVNFKHELGDWGWGNNELENYTNSPENSFHTPDGKLVIRAIAKSGAPPKEKYTSARLSSHQLLGRRCGYLEATISPPAAKGIWPAFWLLPQEPFKWPEDGEVDIMESWNAESQNHACLHWGHYHGADLQKHRVVETSIRNITSPHVYGFAWEQPEAGEGGRCVWYIDGKAIMKANRPPGTRRFEDFRILLNVAMGGNVCQGQTPKDGAYEMVVHELKLCDEPMGGWGQFNNDCSFGREGHAM